MSNLTNWDDMTRNVGIINEAGEPGFKVETTYKYMHLRGKQGFQYESFLLNWNYQIV